MKIIFSDRDTRSASLLKWPFIAGVGFVFAVALVLVLQACFVPGSHVLPLSTTDVIALLAGSVTAAALTGVWIQVKQIHLSEQNRKIDELRQYTLHFDSLHAAFNAMRDDRSRAYVYLKFISSRQELLDAYARHWTNDIGFAAQIPSRNDVRRLFSHPYQRDAATTHDQFAGLSFVDYDRSTSAVVAFFVRLSVHVRPVQLGVRQISFIDDEVGRQAIGPFHWNSYWREPLLKLAAACRDVHDERHPIPYFVTSLEQLDQLIAPPAA